MRRSTALLVTALFLLPATFACEGPTGPAGPAGADGAAGPAGPAGQVGPALPHAKANRTQCHTGAVAMFAKQVHYPQRTPR